MQKMAFIGCGGIGRCHIDGILKKKLSNFLILIDSSQDSIDQTISIIKQHENFSDELRILTFKKIQDCTEQIDYAVISTLSDIRYQILSELNLTQKNIKHIILEKVLFNEMKQYEDANKFFGKSTKIWVNTARRHFDYYKKAKLFMDEKIEYIHITGGSFGIGCNGIHFLDLVCFFSGSHIISNINNALDNSIYESKRDGFIEFHGSIIGIVDKVRFIINSVSNNKFGTNIFIASKNKEVFIDEGNGLMIMYDNLRNTKETINFTLPLLSDFSSEIALDIVKTGKCALPSLRESAVIHKPLIKLLYDHACKYKKLDEGICPIT